MKLVFRIWKMLEHDIEIDEAIGRGYASVQKSIDALKSGWPQKLDGKTLDECTQEGWQISIDWCVKEN